MSHRRGFEHFPAYHRLQPPVNVGTIRLAREACSFPARPEADRSIEESVQLQRRTNMATERLSAALTEARDSQRP